MLLLPSSMKLRLPTTLRLLTIPLHPMIRHPPMTRVVHLIQVEAVIVVAVVAVTNANLPTLFGLSQVHAMLGQRPPW
jgi:hypothetical protein